MAKFHYAKLMRYTLSVYVLSGAVSALLLHAFGLVALIGWAALPIVFYAASRLLRGPRRATNALVEEAKRDEARNSPAYKKMREKYANRPAQRP